MIIPVSRRARVIGDLGSDLSAGVSIAGDLYSGDTSGIVDTATNLALQGAQDLAKASLAAAKKATSGPGFADQQTHAGIAGAAKGAALGGALGSVIPGLGNVVGGFVGGVAGFFAGAFSTSRADTGHPFADNIDLIKGSRNRLMDSGQPAASDDQLDAIYLVERHLRDGEPLDAQTLAFAASPAPNGIPSQITIPLLAYYLNYTEDAVRALFCDLILMPWLGDPKDPVRSAQRILDFVPARDAPPNNVTPAQAQALISRFKADPNWGAVIQREAARRAEAQRAHVLSNLQNQQIISSGAVSRGLYTTGPVLQTHTLRPGTLGNFNAANIAQTASTYVTAASGVAAPAAPASAPISTSAKVASGAALAALAALWFFL